MNTSFERIWVEFNSPMKVYVKKHINNEQDVEDILQTIFIKILHNIDQLSDVEKLGPWIYTIARNVINDFYRARYHDLQVENLPDDFMMEQHDDKVMNQEIGNCLIHMIQDLPDIYKQALILTEFEHYTQKDLAKLLGLSVSGAKSRVQRARAKLKCMMLDCCSIEQDHRGNIIDYKHKDSKCNYCGKRT